MVHYKSSDEWYYINAANWMDATQLYSDNSGTIASTGYYSDGVNARQWTASRFGGGSFGSTELCNPF